MRLVKLTDGQVEKVYQERMIEDFPPNELDPLAVIMKAVEQGRYGGVSDGEGLDQVTGRKEWIF